LSWWHGHLDHHRRMLTSIYKYIIIVIKAERSIGAAGTLQLTTRCQWLLFSPARRLHLIWSYSQLNFFQYFDKNIN